MRQLRHVWAFLAIVCSFGLQAQSLKVPAASPLQTLKQSFGLGDITIEYSRPSVKGRVIFGGLLPYGKMWRTGANASTKITFTEDVKVSDKDIKAGTYAIYTIPNKDSWEILLNTDVTLAGNVAAYKTETEVARFTVKSTSLSDNVETFTININNITATSATIELTWEKTKVAFPVTTEIDEKVMKNIEATMNTDARPYFQAASYYYENNKDLNQALIWATKATELNPNAFWMTLLKAKIELKLKDGKSALASANKTLELAKAANNEDYQRMAEQIIAEVKQKR
ncbi:MAG: DUF2911 domain-containing protein [Cytophagaceae bacterium]